MTTSSAGSPEKVVVEEASASAPRIPRVLFTNDDGIGSEGILVLTRAFQDEGYDLVVAAPATEMSGSGTGIGRWDSGRGIELQKVDLPGIDQAYAVSGTPGLAVMAAALGAFGAAPDLVVSGINAGMNTGHSVIHSGTVGAVLTARTFGSHGLAVSLGYSGEWYWESAAQIAVQAAKWILAQSQKWVVLNVNVPGVPRSQLRGVRWAELDNFGVFRVATADLAGNRLQFEVGGSQAGDDPNTDTYLCNANFVTLTPLSPIHPVSFPDVSAEDVIVLPDA